jgi:FkbM family methyltransferase
VKQWLRAGDSVIDAGTNLGLYTFVAADRVGPSGEVLSVDADPGIVSRMEKAAALLGTAPIRPLHCAVSDRSGTLTFYVRTDGSTTADQSLIPEAALVSACTPVSVPAHRFTDLVSKLTRAPALSLVKIDIEGAEAQALGTVSPELLNRNGPLWIVEINPGVLARFGTTSSAVIEYFPATEFELWIVPKHPLGSATPAIRHYTSTDPLSDSLYYNLVAVPLGQRWADRRLAIADYRPTGP